MAKKKVKKVVKQVTEIEPVKKQDDHLSAMKFLVRLEELNQRIDRIVDAIDKAKRVKGL